METYIVNDCLHITLTPEENQALHGVNMPAAPTAERKAGNRILQALMNLQGERLARGCSGAYRITVSPAPTQPEARHNGPLDPLTPFADLWATKAAQSSPYPVGTLRTVARICGNESLSQKIIDVSARNGLDPVEIANMALENSIEIP